MDAAESGVGLVVAGMDAAIAGCNMTVTMENRGRVMICSDVVVRNVAVAGTFTPANMKDFEKYIHDIYSINISAVAASFELKFGHIQYLLYQNAGAPATKLTDTIYNHYTLAGISTTKPTVYGRIKKHMADMKNHRKMLTRFWHVVATYLEKTFNVTPTGIKRHLSESSEQRQSEVKKIKISYNDASADATDGQVLTKDRLERHCALCCPQRKDFVAHSENLSNKVKDCRKVIRHLRKHFNTRRVNHELARKSKLISTYRQEKTKLKNENIRFQKENQKLSFNLKQALSNLAKWRRITNRRTQQRKILKDRIQSLKTSLEEAKVHVNELTEKLTNNISSQCAQSICQAGVYEAPLHKCLHACLESQVLIGKAGNLVSNNPNSDKQDKRRRGRGQDGKGRGERVSSGAPRGGVFGRGRGATAKLLNKWAPNKKDQTEHSIVTLEDIKNVTFERMGEVHPIPEEFNRLFGREQFNIFLLYLMSYFNCYFNKVNLETKKNPMYIEPSIAEKQDYANACDRLNVAQMLLGRSYCILVLGLGLQDQHHMECGRSRVSKTYTDRSLYETFYKFCTFLVWITFRRRDYDAVEKEIGRILRSNTFNPAIRVKYSAAEPKEPDPTKAKTNEEDKKEEENKKPQDEVKLTPAEYRRLHPKRPAIKTIVNQRSPAIVSIIPSPREEADWLFKKTQLQNMDPNKRHDEALNVEEQYSDLLIDVSTFKVGILGEPYKMFNPLTLSPIGTENEDETNEGDSGEKGLSEDAASEQKSPISERGLSRQQTAISHATTEAMTDDES